MNINRVYSIKQGLRTINTKDYDKIKIALDKIRSDAEEVISDFNKKKITYPLFNFLFRYHELCCTQVFRDRVIINWKNKNIYVSTEKIQKWIDKLQQFCIEIQLPV